MLGKLIKYEFKATWKLFILLHTILLIIAVFGRFMVQKQLDLSAPSGAFLLFILTYLSALFVIGFASMAFLIARFYKNLFTDEGYLMLTLPVTPGQLLLSKTITGSLWMLFDITVMYIAVTISFVVPKLIDASAKFLPTFEFAAGITANTFLLYLLLLSIIGCVCGILMMYVSVAVGQLFSKHRVLTAVISYFLLSFIMQAIVMAAIISSGMLPIGVNMNGYTHLDMKEYMLFTFNATTIVTILLGIFSYIITYYIMNKKINLN